MWKKKNFPPLIIWLCWLFYLPDLDCQPAPLKFRDLYCSADEQPGNDVLYDFLAALY
jgi:hypothetical protein